MADITIDCSLQDEELAIITCTITGSLLSTGIEPNIFSTTTSISGTFVGSVLPTTVIPTITLSIHGDITVEELKKNWIAWSRIGYLSFTKGRDNIAGDRPLDWSGWVYVIKKLGNKVVVYGQNGISLVTPSGTAMGLSTLSTIGLKGKQAVCGTDFIHFYVDVDGRLCRVGETIEILDYSEYLSPLASTITLSYDEQNQLVYICDGQYGYVYSVRDKSLGEGPGNITGIGWKDGSIYVAAPATITTPPFDLCTDIYDLGTRKNKLITSIEFGVDLTETLYAAIDYRHDKAEAFVTTEWKRVNPNGFANIPCFGVEFRFRARVTTYEYFELDYIRVHGQVHNYSYLDSLASRGV